MTKLSNEAGVNLLNIVGSTSLFSRTTSLFLFNEAEFNSMLNAHIGQFHDSLEMGFLVRTERTSSKLTFREKHQWATTAPSRIRLVVDS